MKTNNSFPEKKTEEYIEVDSTERRCACSSAIRTILANIYITSESNVYLSKSLYKAVVDCSNSYAAACFIDDLKNFKYNLFCYDSVSESESKCARSNKNVSAGNA